MWDGDNDDRNGQKSIPQFGRLEVARAATIGALDDDDRDLGVLIGFAVGAPLVLLLGMSALYMAIGRKEDVA